MKLLLIAALAFSISIPATPVKAAPMTQAEKYWEPQNFEPFLKRHPADIGHREYALKWYGYGNYQRSLDKLKHHTFQMLRYDPTNRYIISVNSAAFRAHPQFRQEAISRLEKMVQHSKGKVSHELYFNIALIYRQAAIPLPTNAASRSRALKYFQMPLNSKLPTSVDLPSAYKAIHYYQAAIESVKGKDFETGFYSDQLATLYFYLGRNQEALKVCEAALSQAGEVSKPGLLVTYGRLLRRVKRIEKAKSVLSQVKEIDHKWYPGHGPGSDTAEAEVQLGLIALSQGDVSAAGSHLLFSVKAIKDENAHFHSIRGSEGLPIGFRLAERLLWAKQNKVVVEYCETVLNKFWKNNTETQQLLKKAAATS